MFFIIDFCLVFATLCIFLFVTLSSTFFPSQLAMFDDEYFILNTQENDGGKSSMGHGYWEETLPLKLDML
jgi:hypothetical protein